MRRAKLFAFAVAVLPIGLALGCTSKGSDKGTGPGGSISLSITPNNGTVAQGGSLQLSATLTRSGGFTGDVVLDVQGLPTGVSGAFSNVTTNGGVTTATGTVTVSASTPAGTYTLTVRGTGSGVDPTTATFTLTVTAAGPAPAYTLSLTPNAISIVQSANNTVTVNIGRTNYTGAITLSVTGAPNGVTTSFNPAAPSGSTNSSTLTVTVGASVTPGLYNLTVQGTAAQSFVVGGGAAAIVDQSAVLALTVTQAAPSPDYSLSLTPNSVTTPQSSQSTTTVNINRTNFTGSVTLGVTGAPNGVTTGFNPAAPTTNTSVLTITVGASVTAGQYTLTITGSGTPGSRNTTLTLTVTTSGGGNGNVTVDVSGCNVANTPAWLAIQDGIGGSWQVLTKVSGAYHATITQPLAGLAYVTTSATTNSVIVLFQASSALTAGVFTLCGGPANSRSLIGTVAGMGVNMITYLNFGGSFSYAITNGPFSINTTVQGPQTLVAYEYPLSGPAIFDRMRFDRNLNPANGASVGTVDMTDAKSFTPISVTNTVANAGTDQVFHGMYYYTDNCAQSVLYSSATFTGTTFTSYGAPGAQQLANEFHGVTLSATSSVSADVVSRIRSDGTRSVAPLAAPNSIRTLQQVQHTLAGQTYTLGSVLPVPVIASLTSGHKRLQASWAQPAEYTGGASFIFTDAAASNPSKSITIIASAAYLGNGNVGIAAPDFSGLSGFQTSTWAPSSANQANWSIFTSNLPGGVFSNACVEGSKVITAARQGIF